MADRDLIQLPEGLRQLPPPTQLNLRGDPGDEAFLMTVKSLTGIDLPVTPNKVATGKDVKALWLSPDEWLIVCETPQADLAGKLEEALKGQHVAVNDLSANRIVFELSGPYCREVLMKCCEMDFHPRVFQPGDCAQTLIAKSQAIIEQTDAAVFHIYVRCSFSRYVGGWLAEALAGYLLGK